MAKFIWDDRYCSGNSVLDEEHRELFDILNRLSGLVDSGDSEDQNLSSLLSELLRYTNHHFDHEEAELRANRYPEAADHLRQHDEFRHLVGEAIFGFKGGTQGMRERLLGFLSRWLVGHIQGWDRRFFDFMEAKSRAADIVSAESDPEKVSEPN